MKQVVPLVLFFLLANVSHAQNQAAENEIKNADTSILEEVVITGSKIEVSKKRVPFSISQINRNEIENSGQINILPVLNMYVPGIFVTERNILGFGVSAGGSGSISVRGVSSSPNTGVLVLVDGHPQYQGIFGHPLPDAYVATDIEKVEILRGPASVLYGTNAMAGVINLITRKNEKPFFSGSAGISTGSYNTQKYYATIGYKAKKWNFFSSINHDQTDGLRDSTDFTITNGYFKAGYTINDHLNIIADLNIAAFEANDNGTIYQPKYFSIDILRGKASLSLYTKFKNSEGAFKLYHNFGTHDLSDGWHSTDRNSGFMAYQTWKPLKGNTLTVGTDARQYGGKANSGLARNELKMITEVAGYVFSQQKITGNIIASAGVRLENNNVFGNQFVPSAGVSYSPGIATTLKANFSKGFRSPTMMELYLFAPNPELEPEKIRNYEVTLLQSLCDNKFKFELTGFIIEGNDLIQAVGQYPNVKRQNIGRFNNKGIEISVNYRPVAGLMIHSNYNYLFQKVKTVAAPRQQYNLTASYSYGKWAFNGNFQLIEKLITLPAPLTGQDYAIVNTRISFLPVKKLTLFVSCNNLFDKKYEINYGYPMPGRNIFGGLSFKF